MLLQRWKWAAKSGVPPPAVVDAMVRGIRTEPAFRNSILHQAVKLIHDYDEISSNGDEVASALCEGKILHAATEVLRLSDPLTEEELEVNKPAISHKLCGRELLTWNSSCVVLSLDFDA